jgi:pectinesterase
VLANGPIRMMFELTYLSWDAGGTKVSEMKRITLDAGQNIDRFESHYKVEGASSLMHAVGIKKAAGSTVVSSREKGWLRTWETMKGNGQLGCAIIMNPAVITDVTEADGNYLVAARVPAAGPAVYYAGFGWDRSGDFAGVDDWERYVDQFAERLRAPVTVSVKVANKE